MGAILFWLRGNWFSLLQTLGIIGGLIFTAISIRQATNARKASDLLTLTEQHRELWNQVYSRPGLDRIFAASVDLVARPVTVAEAWFMNEVIVHFHTGWQLTCRGSLLALDAVKADVQGFFSLPIPKAVWEQTKSARDPKFVCFIEDCLRGKKA